MKGEIVTNVNDDVSAFRKEPGIYHCICGPNNKSYIGQSVDVYTRINHAHIPQLKGNRHRNRYMQNSWNKYGEDSFKWEVLEYCSKDALNDREKYWINCLHTEFPNGFNLTTGGDNMYERSEDSRNRMREAWDESRKKSQGSRNREKWADGYEREKWCRAMADAWTDERRKVMSDKAKCRWANMSEEDRELYRKHMGEHHHDVSGDKNPRARSVRCFENGVIFTTIKEAALSLGLNYSTLKSHLKGRLECVNGLHFEYIK